MNSYFVSNFIKTSENIHALQKKVQNKTNDEAPIYENP